MTKSSMRGRLLVATPALREPTFDRTVVLMLEHGDEGALGVVLNRPSELELGEAVPEWEAFAAPPPVVFFGGPVGQGTAICLASASPQEEGEGWTPLSPQLGALDIGKSPHEVAHTIHEIRIFSGHAGWAPGQLEGELAEGAWFAVDADAGDALSAEPLTLWQRVLRRQPGRVAIFAGFPPDPMLN